MDWVWTGFNLICGAAGLAGLWLAIRAESRARSVEKEVQRVVARNRRILLAQDVFAAIGDAKLSLEASNRAVRMVHLDRLRDSITGIRAGRELDLRQHRSLQRVAADLGRIVDFTPKTERSVRQAIDHLLGLRRELIDQATEP